MITASTSAASSALRSLAGGDGVDRAGEDGVGHASAQPSTSERSRRDVGRWVQLGVAAGLASARRQRGGFVALAAGDRDRGDRAISSMTRTARSVGVLARRMPSAGGEEAYVQARRVAGKRVMSRRAAARRPARSPPRERRRRAGRGRCARAACARGCACPRGRSRRRRRRAARSIARSSASASLVPRTIGIWPMPSSTLLRPLTFHSDDFDSAPDLAALDRRDPDRRRDPSSCRGCRRSSSGPSSRDVLEPLDLEAAPEAHDRRADAEGDAVGAGDVARSASRAGAIVAQEVRSSSLPSSVSTDSGWNWTPSAGSSRWRIPMITPPPWAETSNTSGRRSGIDDQRVVAPDRQRRRSPAKIVRPSWVDLARLAVHRLAAHDDAAERLRQRLVAEADAQRRHAGLGEPPHHLDADAGLVGRARSRRDDDAVGPALEQLVDGRDGRCARRPARAPSSPRNWTRL